MTEPLFPESAAAFLGEILAGPMPPAEQDGPPWVHTFTQPEPDGYGEDGEPYWLPPKMFTIEPIGGHDAS